MTSLPMTDLLSRLRISIGANPYTGEPIHNKLRMEAADEIERLQARVEWYDRLDLERIDEINRLLAVVRAIDESEPGKPTAWRYRREELVEMAREALEAHEVREGRP